jgi:hypothetical protein
MSLIDSLRAFFALGPDEEEPVPPPPPADAGGDPLGADWKQRIPTSSLQRVLVIRDLVRDLEKETAQRGLQTELDELGRVKGTHLPRLIQSYIEIPAQHRSDVFRETGKSASFLLNESLDKMLARLRDISSQLARGNITTFAENVRFVDLYYEQSKGPFDPS